MQGKDSSMKWTDVSHEPPVLIGDQVHMEQKNNNKPSNNIFSLIN